MDQLGHLLIRAYNGDTFDPFFIPCHPHWTQEGHIVRACFYYAIIVTDKLTFLFDNDGRGGMCDLVPEELGAIWRTRDLLETFGVTLEALRDGSAVLQSETPILPPALNRRDLTPLVEALNLQALDD